MSKTPLTNRESEKCCTMDTVRKRIPILQWLPNYSLSYLGQDFLAGLTVGLTAIPQGIAYATVADIPAEVGTNCLSFLFSYFVCLDISFLIYDGIIFFPY